MYEYELMNVSAMALILSIPFLALIGIAARWVYEVVERKNQESAAAKRSRELDERLLRKEFRQLLRHIWVYSEFVDNRPHPSESPQRNYNDPQRVDFVDHRRLDNIQILGTFEIMEALHLSDMRDTTRNLIDETWGLTNELSKLQDARFQPFEKPESGMWMTLRDLHYRIGYSVFLRVTPWSPIEGETALRAKIWLEMLPRIFDSIIHEKSDLAMAQLRMANLRGQLERIFTQAVVARRYHYNDEHSWLMARDLVHDIYHYRPTLDDLMDRAMSRTGHRHGEEYEQPLENITGYDSMAEVRPRLFAQRRAAALKAAKSDNSIW